MKFPEAVESGLRHYAKFMGRASRSEYWFWVLFVFLVTFAAGMVDQAVFGKNSLLSALTSFAAILPGVSVAIRRAHDLDRSGLWVLLGLIPLLGPLFLMVFSCFRGSDGPNRFGPDPLVMDVLPL